MIDAFADPEIQRWHFLRIDSLAEAEEWLASTLAGWQSETVATWAIAAGEPSEVVGRISLYFQDLGNGLGEVSYWVAPRARCAGLATDALAAVSTWAFDELGMHRLEVAHSVATQRSSIGTTISMPASTARACTASTSTRAYLYMSGTPTHYGLYDTVVAREHAEIEAVTRSWKLRLGGWCMAAGLVVALPLAALVAERADTQVDVVGTRPPADAPAWKVRCYSVFQQTEYTDGNNADFNAACSDATRPQRLTSYGLGLLAVALTAAGVALVAGRVGQPVHEVA